MVDIPEIQVGRGQLLTFRDKLQSMCYWWKETRKHGSCKENNHSENVCTFCELVEELDRILK